MCALAVSALVLASALLLTTSAAASVRAPSTARALDAPSQVLLVPAGQSSVKVRWQADVRGPQGEFLVLSGADFGSLRVVARVAATGDGEYGVADLQAAVGSRVIQLRYLDPRGRLHVLATQEILVESELRPADVWTANAPQPLLTFFASKQVPGPQGLGSFAPPATERAVSTATQPPTPPPRTG